MKFSLMTYTVAPNQPGGLTSLEAMADLAVELGFEALELSAGHLGDRSAREFAEICQRRDLRVSCLNGGCDLANADDDEFAQGLDQARYYIELAMTLNCPVVMLIPGLATDQADKPRATERIAEGLCAVVEGAAQQGILVTLEDFPNPLAPYCTIAEMQFLLEAVPGLHLTFDNGNWMIGGDDPLQALKALGSYIVNVHLKDWEPDPDNERLQLPDGQYIRGGLHGKGLIDHKPILTELKRQGYGGYLAFEYEGPLNHTLATRQGLSYLRQVLAGL